jgi:hypothetical protein
VDMPLSKYIVLVGHRGPGHGLSDMVHGGIGGAFAWSCGSSPGPELLLVFGGGRVGCSIMNYDLHLGL